jgi:signal-transduction protein with cAMP-binding, CBS, and nucleotidyltransferase domain
MEKVNAVLAKKQHHFNHIHPDTSLRDALMRMNCEQADYLVVMDDEERFLGVLTEREVTSGVISKRKPVDKIKVKDVMNTVLPVVSCDDTVENCMKLMTQFRVRHLPVYDNFTFCGVVTSDDILQEAIYRRDAIFDETSEPIF